ncbi:DUF2934 domain-containing protein [Sphingomonas sp. IC-56]|uniref:DUF2934 domain-containing protein n=1 Tax=Sphingomonas sp. IC-56 TaxID=2898529 RepID=UPI001E4B3847|nr:DUF2934 domain-containing protein [Sphingomonas sp. IC-56]MCD2324304.1 DUF2934 domain-containing protein [Sphingomonas sp. IC-56]
MSDDREHKVRERAYALWETEGRPSGRHEEHWHRANSEFPEASSPAQAPVPTAAKPKRRKPVAASPAAAEAPSAVEATTPAPRKRRTLKPKAN